MMLEAYSRSIEKILFASDLHGNQLQYNAILQYACMKEVDLLIFGGDLLPKSSTKRTVDKQYVFFKKKLLPLLKRFVETKDAFRKELDIVFIYGNDDFAAIYDDVKRELSYIGITMLCNDIYSYKNFDIIGYSYVPLTPFKYKDWEKWDYKDDHQRKTNYVTDGLISTKTGLSEVSIVDINNRSSIHSDLNLLFSKAEKPVIFVCHAPPRQTNLDYTYGLEHVGSDAVKHAILEYQPVLSLHGHIHESAQLTRKYKDRLRKTRCFTTGNFFNQKVVRSIEVTLKGQKYIDYKIVVIGSDEALAQYAQPDHGPPGKSFYTWIGKHSSENLRHLVYVTSRLKK